MCIWCLQTSPFLISRWYGMSQMGAQRVRPPRRQSCSGSGGRRTLPSLLSGPRPCRPRSPSRRLQGLRKTAPRSRPRQPRRPRRPRPQPRPRRSCRLCCALGWPSVGSSLRYRPKRDHLGIGLSCMLMLCRLATKALRLTYHLSHGAVTIW